MRQAPLLTLHDVVIESDAHLRIGPINWTINRAQRIWLETEDEAQFLAIGDLLSGRLRPMEGYVEELHRVRVQSDYRLRGTAILNRSITDYLNSSDVPEQVWLENRRRSVRVLLDRLGLYANHSRLPLKFQSAEVMEKFAAFRFIISRADLLIGNQIFGGEDAEIEQVLRMRWLDFPGAVIACAELDRLPGAPDTHAAITGDGAFSVAPHQQGS